MNSYHDGESYGGGTFTWRENLPKSLHDGGLYIDPTKTLPNDFENVTETNDWFKTTNSGSGVYERNYSGDVHVMWFGAKDVSGFDSTICFNAACQSHIPYGTYKERRVLATGGRYDISGTVYLRLGCSLTGKITRLFMGATGSVKFGYREDGVKDSGGHPPMMDGFWLEGGSAPVDINVSGYFLSNIFFSFPSTPPLIGGVDGVVSNLIIDNASVGISWSASSTTATNILFYRCISQIKFDTCRFSTFIGCNFEYADEQSLLIDNLSGSVKELKGVTFQECKFKLSTQYSSFKAFIKTKDPQIEGDFTFYDCKFVNGKGPAVLNESTSEKLSLNFRDCTFDGIRSISTETQGTTFFAYEQGNTGKAVVEFNDCKFKDCFDSEFKITGIESGNVKINRPEFINSQATYHIEYSNTNESSILEVRDVKGCG